MNLKPIAVVIPEEKFRDEELFVPLEVWKEAHTPFVLVSTRKGEIEGDLGGRAEATLLLSELKADEYSTLAVIGGSGTARHLWGHPGLQAVIKAFAAAGKPIAAICAGVVPVAQTGLLTGRTATTYPVQMMADAVQAAGAIYTDVGLVDHGDVITASGPGTARDFARAVAAVVAR